jgi:hypothetical protein
MKIRHIANTLVNLTSSIRLLLDKIIYRLDKNNISKLRDLEGLFKDKPLVIVGNGPSLNKVPLEKIKFPCIGMNKINLIFKRTKWRPWCIISINGLVVNQNKEYFNTTDLKLFLPVKSRYLGIKKRENIFFTYETKNETFVANISDGLGAGHTVTYSALQLAYYLGANPVYLIGVDHSFSYDGKANDIQIQSGDDKNHFDPEYFKNKLWGIPDLQSSERAYKNADMIYKNSGRIIYDATIDGKLDIFEKKSIDHILE